MALLRTNILRFSPAILQRIQKLSQEIHKTINLELGEPDVIDHFTSQLLQRKVGEWQTRRTNFEMEKAKSWSKSKETQTDNVNVINLPSKDFKLLFETALSANNSTEIRNLMQQCVQLKKCPPLPTLLLILTDCAQNGDKYTIAQSRDLLAKCDPTQLKNHANFDYFLAEAVWVKGDTSKALSLFENTYKSHPHLRRTVRLILKHLIGGVVTDRSEAALIAIIEFCRRISNDFHDFYPMCCVWQSCFLSEWYSDQKIALDLLEANKQLRGAVINRISYVVFVSLQDHRTEIVYRLLEILLKYEMKEQYGSVLVTLLDFQFRQRDFQSCSEIIEWSIKHNVELPSHHYVEMINLLLNEKLNTPLVRFKPKIDGKYKYNLKF